MLNLIFSFIKKKFQSPFFKAVKERTKNYRWGRIVLIICGVPFILYLVKSPELFQRLAEKIKIVLEDKDFSLMVFLITLFFGVIHLFVINRKKAAKEHLFYRSLGPIVSSPLTCLTFGAIINSSLILLYIVCFDENTLKKYYGWDKSTVIFTSIALFVWSIDGFGKIIGDICNPKDEKEGIILSEETDNSNNASNSNPSPDT